MYIAELGKAVVEGVLSIPSDLAHGTRRTFEDVAGQKAVRLENQAERERIWRVIKRAIDLGSSESGPINRIVKIILTEFYDLLPDSAIESIAKKAGVGASFMAGRATTQVALVTLIANKIAKEIALRATIKRLVKFGLGAAASALLIQGFIEKASEASKRLLQNHPKIHSLLKQNDLDMAFLLVEDSMRPILAAVEMHSINATEFENLVEDIIDDI